MNRLRWLIITTVALSMLLAWIGISRNHVDQIAQEPDGWDAPPPEGPLSGPDVMRQFFTDWYEPYDAVLPVDVMADIQEQVRQVPVESDKRLASEWELVGPSGSRTPASALYSGRILDLNLDGQMRVAAASGGLWEYNFLFPSPLTEDLTSQWIGSFDVHPTDQNTMIVGTGEPFVQTGTGLWRTADGGSTWNSLPVWPPFQNVFRIRYGPAGNMVHAATNRGYYRSTNSGDSWTRFLEGVTTDLLIDPQNSDRLFVTVWDEGLYVSADAGLTWDQVTTSGIPTEDVSRGAVSVCAGAQGCWYVAFAHDVPVDGHVMKGIYKTLDSGNTWLDKSPVENYMGGQGWYNNVIAVCPTNINLVLAGGVKLLRSVDGGTHWEVLVDDHLHADYHAIKWSDDGQKVWVGHDGGWSYSNNQGVAGSWTSGSNTLPITQYVNIDIASAGIGSFVVGGGSQDNGTTISIDGGSSWDYRRGGDGGAFTIAPANNQTIYISDGVYGGGWSFLRSRSQDMGVTWAETNVGIWGSYMWYPKIRVGGDTYLYTNSDYNVYRADPTSMVWQPIGSGQTEYDVWELTVSDNISNPIVYACLKSDNDQWRLTVNDNGNWSERSSGLVLDARVRKVVPHPYNNNTCFALMNGLGTPGSKVYRSDNRGRVWINITGNLPNVPMADLIVDPVHDQVLYLGTAMGVYRTINGGQEWVKWNLNLPEAVVVTELRTLDHREVDGTYWLVAGTYGRSIWRRIMEDPITGVDDLPSVASVAIRDMFPNPANPSLTIRFAIPLDGAVEVEIHDVRGRRVRVLQTGDLPRGEHEIVWDGKDDRGSLAASGTYIAMVKTAAGMDSRKVTIVK